jgi:hypothetical protein
LYALCEVYGIKEESEREVTPFKIILLDDEKIGVIYESSFAEATLAPRRSRMCQLRIGNDDK